MARGKKRKRAIDTDYSRDEFGKAATGSGIEDPDSAVKRLRAEMSSSSSLVTGMPSVMMVPTNGTVPSTAAQQDHKLRCALLEMLQMGFEKTRALQALKACNINVEDAIPWAIKSKEEEELAAARRVSGMPESKVTDDDLEDRLVYNQAVEASLLAKEEILQNKEKEIENLKLSGDIKNHEAFSESSLLAKSEFLNKLVVDFSSLPNVTEGVAEDPAKPIADAACEGESTDLKSNTALREELVSLLMLESKCVMWYKDPAKAFFSQRSRLCPSSESINVDLIISWLRGTIKEIEDTVFSVECQGKTPKLFLDAYDPPTVDLSSLDD